MKRLLLAALLATPFAAQAHGNHAASPTLQKAHPAMTHTVESKYPFDETVRRLTDAVTGKGMTVFATIDHQAAAQKDGLTMQPAKVIVFGTPKAGTPLMIKDPAFALQLPLRVLVTEADGKVLVVFNDTHALVHGSKIQYSEVESSLAKAEGLIKATVTQ